MSDDVHFYYTVHFNQQRMQIVSAQAHKVAFRPGQPSLVIRVILATNLGSLSFIWRLFPLNVHFRSPSLIHPSRSHPFSSPSSSFISISDSDAIFFGHSPLQISLLVFASSSFFSSSSFSNLEVLCFELQSINLCFTLSFPYNQNM